MKVWITLDMLDGSRSRLRGPVYLDEVDLFGLKLYLNRKGVAGVSFVRADLLNRLDQLEQTSDD